jgi:hydroxypyruvate reductase
MSQKDTEQLLLQAFQEVLRIADPKHSLPIALKDTFPNPIKGNCLVVGGGKASAAMADAFEKYTIEHWPEANVYGHIVTRYDHDVTEPIKDRKIKVSQAGHPMPDISGMNASQHMMQLLDDLQPGDRCIALISGGGSSLLAYPPEGVSLQSLTQLSKELLRSGAPIEEMNVIRKHVSNIQGGRLAQLAMQKGVFLDAFIISDVTGDQPSDIASGPCSPDPSTFVDAMAIFKKFHLDENPLLLEIKEHLHKGVMGKIPDTLKTIEMDPNLVRNHVFATAQKGLQAASDFCLSQGFEVISLGDQITGEARDFALKHTQLIEEKLQISSSKKIAWISGGETTVTIPQGIKGRGGRCSEFLLALLQATQNIGGISALAADTDGIDGTENNAGAFFSPSLRQKSWDENLSIDEHLKSHDAYGFFNAIGGLVITGPTLTNVNDFRIVLIDRNNENNVHTS